MSIEEVRQHVIEVAPGKRFFCDLSIVDRTFEVETQRETQQSSKPYTVERERTMLKDFGRHVLDLLHGRATDVRSGHALVLAEAAADGVGAAAQGDRIQAQVCRLPRLMTTSAQARSDERDRLRFKGYSDDEIDRIDAAAQRYAGVENERDWFIGPKREVLLFHLGAVGIAPLDANVMRLRANALCLMTS